MSAAPVQAVWYSIQIKPEARISMIRYSHSSTNEAIPFIWKYNQYAPFLDPAELPCHAPACAPIINSVAMYLLVLGY